MTDREQQSPQQTADSFLRRRAGEARPFDPIGFLERAADETPIAGDEIAKAS